MSGRCLRLLLPAALLFFCGCASIGPPTITQDRFDYNTAITDSWKRQTLLNIVKLRYLDPPSFMDIGQIVSGYSLETGVEAAGQLAKVGAGDQFIGVNGRSVFTDRPTITYTPLAGSRFVRGLLVPIQIENVFFAIQSGWSADYLFNATVSAINGLRNEEVSFATGYTPADPKFRRAAELLSRIQRSGAVAIKIVQDEGKRESKYLAFQARMASPQTLQEIAEFRELLGLAADVDEYRLVFGVTASSRQEIAIQTRAFHHILNTMAGYVEIPAQDLADGRATSIDLAAAGASGVARPRIRSSASKPDDAFAAVEYQKHWFWVDNRDLETKRSFSFMMLIATLSDSSDRDNMPLLTIPTR